MYHPEYGYFNMHFLFLIIWLPALSSGEGINLTYFISKNEIMMLKCEIPDNYCCSDVNKIEFFKNGDGVCTFKDCPPFFDVPLHIEYTRFYRCGCSVNNIRKTHLITTELRKTDYGNWSCASSCGDVTCRSNTLSILPPEENGEGMNLRYFISKNEIMMLKCEIPDDFCCSNINKIVFFKNGEGVCTFQDCLPFFDVPLQGEDTLFYRCGCSVGNIRKTHLLTTKLRTTDYGNWSCACSCGYVTCRSNTISILPPDSHEKNVTSVDFPSQEESDDESTRLIASANTADTLTISENTQETESYSTCNKPVWCICGKCEERKLHSERLCCGYVECVTLHHDFETYCFKDIDVTLSSDSQKQTKKRIRAYENYNYWMHKINDKQELITVPACCVSKIRNKFPDPKGQYCGVNKRIYFPLSQNVQNTRS